MSPHAERGIAPRKTETVANVTQDDPAAALNSSRAITLRVLSAAVLLPAGVWLIWLGGLALASAAAVVGVIMSFEWARMQSPGRVLPNAFVLGFGAVVCPILAGLGHFQWMAPFLTVSAICAALLHDSWIKRLEIFCGAIYVAAPCAAFVWLRSRPDDGLILAFALAGIIWSSDMAAYFVGRAVGGPKIFPETSPRKTWAGFVGGAAAGAAAAAAFGVLVDGHSVVWALAGAAISVVGQFGDMFESLVKRHFAVKDASGLIPGHGGFLDRLDALMAASVFCALVLNWAPALTPDVKAAALSPAWR